MVLFIFNKITHACTHTHTYRNTEKRKTIRYDKSTYRVHFHLSVNNTCSFFLSPPRPSLFAYFPGAERDQRGNPTDRVAKMISISPVSAYLPVTTSNRNSNSNLRKKSNLVLVCVCVCVMKEHTARWKKLQRVCVCLSFNIWYVSPVCR